jgi:hypothetical protein
MGRGKLVMGRSRGGDRAWGGAPTTLVGTALAEPVDRTQDSLRPRWPGCFRALLG